MQTVPVKKRFPIAGMAERRSFTLLVSVFVALLEFCSCTRQVELSLKSRRPQLVIEAVVSNGTLGSYVKLSWSQPFAVQADYTDEANALVVLSDSTRGLKDTLSIFQGTDGHPYFRSRWIRPITGHVYHLKVQLDDKEYTARSVMPDTVTFQGITLLSEAGRLSESSVFTVVPKYVDQGGVRNYYRFEQYVNHKKDPGVSVMNDNVGDGLMNERPIFTKDIDIHLGDTLTVVMIQITQPVYQYFYQLSQNQEELGATPDNPVSNIEGGALGYFSAEDRQYFTAKISDDN